MCPRQIRYDSNIKATVDYRWQCSRTGWEHTYSAAATKLFDVDGHFQFFLFPFSCSLPGTVVLGNSFNFLGYFKHVYDDDDNHEVMGKMRACKDVGCLQQKVKYANPNTIANHNTNPIPNTNPNLMLSQTLTLLTLNCRPASPHFTICLIIIQFEY